jgi:hypothetical protein
MCNSDGDWNAPSTEALIQFVGRGNSAIADSLLQLLPPEVASRSDARQYLTSPLPIRRLLGLIRVTLELSYAVDPKAASRLSISLQPLVIGETFAALGYNPALGVQHQISFLAASAHAALQIGDFERSLAIDNEAAALPVSDAALEPSGWCDDVRYEALIRTFRFDEAWQIRRGRKPGAAPLSSRAEELDQMLDVFAPDPDAQIIVEPEPSFSWLEKTRILTAMWLPAQRKITAAFMQSFAALPLSPDERAILDRRFHEADRSLEKIENAVVLDIPSDDDRDDILHREMLHYQTVLRAIQGFRQGRQTTLEDNRHRLNFAASIFGLKAPTNGELDDALSSATAATEWSARVGDRHGEVMALWTVGLVQHRRGAGNAALRAFEAVFRRLVSLRSTGLTSAQARSLLAVTFRTLIPRIADLAVQFEEHGLAFEALEFRRGIAVVESDLRRKASGKADQSAGVHYFAVSVFPEHGIFAALRTADGTTGVLRVDIEHDGLDALVIHIDPRTWPQRLLRPAWSPRAELAALMQPLERAFAAGAIRQDDHVTVALDHPLHTVPIHYLQLGDDLAVRRLSFSRVASFEDMRRIAATEPSPVTTVATVFIPTRDAADTAGDTKAFQSSIAPVRHLVHATVEGEAADRDAVIEALRANDLVHLHAHGYFPEVPPDITIDTIRQAGILVASEGRLPSRSHPEESLLSPRDLLEASGITAKYVSLAACVSGLGRPGRGGDMLGLEFAFRLGGVESVVASHWHVETRLAAAFYAAYYRSWLIDGRPKAAAWRNVTLQLIDERHGRSIVEACAQCAFSLFGDWR